MYIMENNQYYITPLYKPVLYQPTTTTTAHVQAAVSVTTTNIMQNSNYLVMNNVAHIVNDSSSSILSSYPLVSDSGCSAWQDPCPTDYLGLPTFDSKQETSPSASPLSTISSNSIDLAIHPSTEDFCVSDLLDPYAHPQQQHYMTSPALTNTVNNSNYYFTQPSMHPPQQQQQHLQGVSPNTEYWISPETPLMETMDGFMTTNPIDPMNYHHYRQQQQEPYFFVKDKEDTAYMLAMNNNDNHHHLMNRNIYTNSSLSSSLGNKRKTKKVHHCPHCHHTSNRANNMKEHILTHDPYRPKLFACNICQKTFARKHDMKRHTKSHLRVPRKQSKSSHLHQHYQV